MHKLNQLNALITIAVLLLSVSCTKQSTELSVSPSSTDKPELVVQTGHSKNVRSVKFSPDGKFLASSSEDLDQSIKLWDVESGRVLRTLPTDQVYSLAFSPDGRNLASGGYDGIVRIWDVASGKELRSFSSFWSTKSHSQWVTSVDFSPNGKTLASSSFDKTIKLWDVASGKELRTLGDRSSAVNSISFSPDGSLLVSGSDDGIVKVWKVDSGAVAHTLLSSAPNQEVSSVTFSPDGSKLASGSHDYTVRLFDVKSGKELHRLQESALVQSVAFSPDGKSLAFGISGGIVKLCDVNSGKENQTLLTHCQFANIHSLAFSPDGRNLASGGYASGGYDDNAVKIWDVASGKELRTLAGNSNLVNAISFSPDGKTLASASDDKTIKLWDLTGMQKELRILAGHSAPIQSLAFSPDGTKLASGSKDTTIKIWNVESGLVLQTLKGHAASVCSIVFSPDGKTVVSGAVQAPDALSRPGDGPTIMVWNVASGKALYSIKPSGITSIGLSPDGKTLVSMISRWAGVELWDLASGRKVCTFGEEREKVCSPDGCVVFSPDGKIVASTSGHSIRLWDPTSGKELRVLEGHYGYAYSVAFSQDAKTLASCYKDAIRLWDVKSGKELRAVTTPVWTNMVTFSPNGKTLASAGGEDTRITLWNNELQELASLCPFYDDWALVTTKGSFDASAGGMRMLHYNVANQVVELGQLKDRFYEPGLLAKIMGFNTEPFRDISGFDKVELYPEIGCEILPDNKSLQIKMRNRGGGIGSILVRINGKLLDIDQHSVPRSLTRETPEVVLTVNLSDAVSVLPGRPNDISVQVFNGDNNLISRDVRPLKQWVPSGNPALSPPEVYAIVGGASQYSDPTGNLNLRYAATDACDFAKALEIGSKRLFGAEKVHMTLLTTTDTPGAHRPSKEEFVKAFEKARSAKPNDIFIVYLSGHGTTIKQGVDTYCYLTSDAYTAELNDPEIRRKTTITSNELLEWTRADAIPALKQVLILDTCAAGAIAEKLSARRDVSGDQIRAVERLKDRSGFYVLMGCTADAVSYEASRFGQGLLTHALLEGMRGPALVEERTEKFVDVQRLFQYAADKVPELAKGIGGIQRPEISVPKGTSFWIGKLSKDDMNAIPMANEQPIILRPSLMGRRRDELNLTAALKARLYDDLSAATRDSATRRTVRAVYVAADEMAGAYLPTGSYHVEGMRVTIDMAVSLDDKEIAIFQVIGSKDSPEELVDLLAEKIYKAVKAI